MGDVSDILEARDTHITVLQHEIKEMCAGYDRLEAENGRLRDANKELLSTLVTIRGLYDMPKTVRQLANKALNPE